MLLFAAAKDCDCAILGAVEAVNDRQELRLLAKLQQHFGSLAGAVSDSGSSVNVGGGRPRL